MLYGHSNSWNICKNVTLFQHIFRRVSIWFWNTLNTHACFYKKEIAKWTLYQNIYILIWQREVFRRRLKCLCMVLCKNKEFRQLCCIFFSIEFTLYFLQRISHRNLKRILYNCLKVSWRIIKIITLWMLVFLRNVSDLKPKLLSEGWKSFHSNDFRDERLLICNAGVVLLVTEDIERKTARGI